MNISKRKIELLQARRQLTNEEFAKRSGVNSRNINLAKNRGSCTIATAGKIAKGLGVDVTEILADE